VLTPNFEQELHKQLLLISEERDSLLSKMEQMSLAISELEVLKEDSNNKASQLLCNLLQVTSHFNKLKLLLTCLLCS
jgi:centromeric protein E